MKIKWLNEIGITAVLFVFWIAVSGSLKWPQLLVGLAVAAFVAYFNRNLNITPQERPAVTFKSVSWLISYLFRLIVEIVKANIQVVRLVLHPKMPIMPHLVFLDVDLKLITSRVLLANSITLTPGTLTVLSDEKTFLVHAIVVEAGESLADWDLITRLRQMEVGEF